MRQAAGGQTGPAHREGRRRRWALGPCHRIEVLRPSPAAPPGAHYRAPRGKALAQDAVRLGDAGGRCVAARGWRDARPGAAIAGDSHRRYAGAGPGSGEETQNAQGLPLALRQRPRPPLGGLQKRTGVRETALGRGLWRHRMLPGRNLRKMLSSYMVEIQGFTATGRSGLSPDRLERTERFRGKCARIGQRCGGVSPDLARREIARTPANTGRKSEMLPRRKSPEERCCEKKNGGGPSHGKRKALSIGHIRQVIGISGLISSSNSARMSDYREGMLRSLHAFRLPLRLS